MSADSAIAQLDAADTLHHDHPIAGPSSPFTASINQSYHKSPRLKERASKKTTEMSAMHEGRPEAGPSVSPADQKADVAKSIEAVPPEEPEYLQPAELYVLF